MSGRSVPDALRIELASFLNDAALGQVVCEVVADGGGEDDRARICAWLGAHLGLDVAAEALHPLELATARLLLTDLFLGPVWGRKVRRKPDAERQARRFEACFDGPRMYSTLRYDLDPSRNQWSWTGKRLVGRSYECGVMVADDARVGMLWFADED